LMSRSLAMPPIGPPAAREIKPLPGGGSAKKTPPSHRLRSFNVSSNRGN
jgi:hypothetical protein